MSGKLDFDNVLTIMCSELRELSSELSGNIIRYLINKNTSHYIDCIPDPELDDNNTENTLVNSVNSLLLFNLNQYIKENNYDFIIIGRKLQEKYNLKLEITSIIESYVINDDYTIICGKKDTFEYNYEIDLNYFEADADVKFGVNIESYNIINIISEELLSSRSSRSSLPEFIQYFRNKKINQLIN